MLEQLVIQYYLRTNKGIRATAKHFGIHKIQAAIIISKFLKSHPQNLFNHTPK